MTPFHWLVDVSNDSPKRHRTVLNDIERVRPLEFIKSVVSSPSHLRCRDFRSSHVRPSDGTNVFVSISTNTPPISVSISMVTRPRRPVTPQEEEIRRKHRADLKRLERERKRRRDDEENDALEQEVQRRHCERRRDQNTTYHRHWLQTRRNASRTPSPETLSAVSPETVENDGRPPEEADVPPQEPNDDHPNTQFQPIDTPAPNHRAAVAMASPTATRPPTGQQRLPPPIPPVVLFGPTIDAPPAAAPPPPGPIAAHTRSRRSILEGFVDS